jgi:apolipoprotein D and lipocalin family protein
MLTGCTGIPKGITPVNNFDINKYQGTWYEIARLDHSFERGLEQVSAQYEIKENGDVNVTNRGFSTKTNQWEEAIGNAKFINETNSGYLKVSFFGPFYGSYIIFELDENYQYAFVSGPDLSYLWLLSRNKVVVPELIEHFKLQSKKYGFDTNEIIMVNQ